jgi:hypothetical protein
VKYVHWINPRALSRDDDPPGGVSCAEGVRLFRAYYAGHSRFSCAPAKLAFVQF